MKNAIAGFLTACAVALLVLAVPGDAQTYVDGKIVLSGTSLAPGDGITFVGATDGKVSTICEEVSGGALNLGCSSTASPTTVEVSKASARFYVRTPNDAAVTAIADSGLGTYGLSLNSIVTATLWASFLKAEPNISRSTAIAAAWDIGNGHRDTLNSTTELDTWTWISGVGTYWKIRPAYQPASGSGSFTTFEVNPTINGTSTGTATALAVFPKTNTLTGGVQRLFRMGTTTTDSNTGNTDKISADLTGKLLYPTGTADAVVGRSVLVAGTVTVSTTSVTANSVVMLTRCVGGGTAGLPQLGTVTAGTSFVINSVQPGTASTLQNADTSTICWKLDN